MELIHIVTKIAILQPNICVTTRLDPSCVAEVVCQGRMSGGEGSTKAELMG